LTGTVTELWRYPVKSMRGERIEEAEVTTAGVVGDRAYAVVDVESGKIGSAKHPRLWGALLQLEARTEGDDVVITLPDGSSVGAGDPDVHERLSSVLGRDVRLDAKPPERPRYLAVWPEGTMPDDDVARFGVGDEEDGTLTDLALAFAAPGTFVDVSALHVVARATLDQLGYPVERWRPNVVVDDERQPYAENAWMGKTLRIGGVDAPVLIPTMRCIMTTLAQGALPRDNEVLKRIKAENRIEIPNMGTWSCVGAYATVETPARVAVGDAFSVG